MISIIIPVYNEEAYLIQCLDSIVNQTYKDLEILIIDDGSTDKSKTICDNYKKTDKRIQVFHTKNKGLSAARNLGLKHAHGEFLMFVDSDDWIDLDLCEKTVSVAKTDNVDLIFWGFVKEFKNAAVNIKNLWGQKMSFDELQVRIQLLRRLFGLVDSELSHPEYISLFDTVWGKLYRSDIVLNNQVSFIDTSIIGTEDVLFNIQTIRNVKAAVYLDKCMYHYRKNNPNSLTRIYNKKLFEQWQNLFVKMEKCIIQYNLPYRYTEALTNRIALSIIGLGFNIINCPGTKKEKKNCIKKILNDKQYTRAIKKLKTESMPFHWKLFFYACKKRLTNGVYYIFVMMDILRNRHNYLIDRR